jgi:hypothetical protein
MLGNLYLVANSIFYHVELFRLLHIRGTEVDLVFVYHRSVAEMRPRKPCQIQLLYSRRLETWVKVW